MEDESKGKLFQQSGEEDKGFKTDVDGVKANDVYKNTPVFDVDEKTFFSNMRMDRNRTRFPNGSEVSKFMQGTSHRSPFYVRYTNKEGSKFLKKFK
jgi:hypothetical protein